MNPVERKNKLLDELKKKVITMQEFEYKIALWAVETECWADYEVRLYPVEPKEVQEYNELPFEKRIKIPLEFFQQPVIRAYLSMKDKIYGDNWADYQWLKQVKSWLPDDDKHLDYHLRLDSKIADFRHWFERSTPETDKLQEVFGGEVIDG
jgi:hypothetical protein